MEEKTPVEIIVKDDVAIVSFKTVTLCEGAEIGQASKQITQYLVDNNPRKMVFDFEGVKFFSSRVLGLLVNVWKKLQVVNGRVVISSIDPQLHRVFKITNLDKIFEFYPDKDAAIKAVNTS